MKLYLHTSALVKLYVDEEGSALVHSGVDASELVATSEIAYLEARSALARRRREHAFSPASYRAILQDFEVDWDRYLKIAVSTTLIRGASGLAERHRLRAYDALHLASAGLLRGETRGEDLMFASWDDTLDRAAKREGLVLLRK